MSVVVVDQATKRSLKSTYRQSAKQLQAVEVPASAINRRGVQNSKISVEGLTSLDEPSFKSKQIALNGNLDLPLKSRFPVDGLAAFKKDSKKGFYDKNIPISGMGTARSPSAKEKRKSASRRRQSPTTTEKTAADHSRLSKSKEYDLKVRELNKRSHKSIIKSAQKILNSSRSVKLHEGLASKAQEDAQDIQNDFVSSFLQGKQDTDRDSSSKGGRDASPWKSNQKQNDPNGAVRVKPEGSLGMHRREYKPTPADLECTFRPNINRQSRFLDEKKQKMAVSPTAASSRHENLLNKGSEYAENRRRKALEQQALESMKEEQACSFKPSKIAQYNPMASNELPIEARSNVWQKRREEKLAKQRQEIQRRAEEELLREGLLPRRHDDDVTGYRKTHRRSPSKESSRESLDRDSLKRAQFGEFTPKKPVITDEEYVNIRLDSIRRSIEKQMSYVESQRSPNKFKD